MAYGPLLNGACVVLFEGVPNHPDWGRTWQIVERHKVSIFYTAPTAIRAQIRAGNEVQIKEGGGGDGDGGKVFELTDSGIKNSSVVKWQ